MDEAAGDLAAAVAGAELVVAVRAGGRAPGRAGGAGGAGARRRRSPTSARPRPASSQRCRRRLRPRFVGGHPICGFETRGAQNARAELFEGATWFLTPLPETEPARLRDLHRLRGRARRDAGRDRRRRARPPGRAHEPPAARAREPARRAGGRGAHRRPRPAHGDRRLVPRHDARRRREPAHLGRHLPRQPRRAREPCCASTSARSTRCSTALEAGDAGYLARWIGEASGHRRRALEAQFDRVPRSSTASTCTCPTGPACSPASRRRSAPRASTSRTSCCTTSRPSAAARSRCSVAGREAADARRRAARRAGLRRDRRARAGGRHVSAATGADRLEVAPAPRSSASWRVPGDKSISHRSLLIGAVCDGTTEVSGFGANADTLATLARRRGAGRARRAARRGRRRACACTAAACAACRPPDGAIDVRNAGTLMRLLPGPARRPERAPSRSTATSRSAAGRSTASRCRCG